MASSENDGTSSAEGMHRNYRLSHNNCGANRCRGNCISGMSDSDELEMSGAPDGAYLLCNTPGTPIKNLRLVLVRTPGEANHRTKL